MKKKLTLLILGVFFLSSCAVNKTQDLYKISDDELPYPVVDVHTHTNFENITEPTSGIPQTKEQYLKELQEAGVKAAVSHNVDWSHQARGKAVLPYQDLSQYHVIQCYGVGEVVNTQSIEIGLKSKKFNCIKIYLGYVHRYAYDPEYKKVYRLAQKYDVPVVFHTGDTYSEVAKLKYADPLTVDEVAVDFKKVNFVIAHCGNPWIESAAEVAYKNNNVYLDGSAFLIGDVNRYSKEAQDQAVVKPLTWMMGYLDNPKKLMFGTDWPLVHIKDYLRIFKRAIPKEHWRDVFYENAIRVFKIKISEDVKKNAK